MKIIRKVDSRLLGLILILLVGFWFKIQGFLNSSFAFTYDVGRDFLAVLEMVSSHKPLLIGATTGLHGVFYGPTWYYILLPVFLLFGGDPSGVALFMAISGVATALLGYFLGKKIGNYTLGLIAALLISLSQVLTQISTQIWNPNLIPFFVLLSFLLIVAYDKKKIYYLFLLGITLGIIFDLELVFGLIYLLATLAFIIISKTIGRKIIGWILLIGGFSLVQLPRIVFEVRHNFLMTRTLLNSFDGRNSESLLTWSPNFSKIFARFLEIFSQTLAWENVLLGLVVLSFISFAIGFFYKKFDKNEQKIVKYCLVILLSFVIALSFFNHDIESHYYIGIPIIFILLLSLSVFSIKKYFKLGNIPFVLIVMFFAILVNQIKIVGSFEKYNLVGDASYYRNQLEVVNYIYKDAAGEKFNTITYTPPIHDYPYQYLFSWWGKRNYGYVPDKNHQKNFYLILEPDLQFPVRLTNWLDERKKDGIIVNEKKFPSGIIVQKRFH